MTVLNYDVVLAYRARFGPQPQFVNATLDVAFDEFLQYWDRDTWLYADGQGNLVWRQRWDDKGDCRVLVAFPHQIAGVIRDVYADQITGPTDDDMSSSLRGQSLSLPIRYAVW